MFALRIEAPVPRLPTQNPPRPVQAALLFPHRLSLARGRGASVSMDKVEQGGRQTGPEVPRG